MKRRLFFRIFLLGCSFFLLFFTQLSAQTEFRGFGHQEFSAVRKNNTDAYFSIGEHDFFVTSNLPNRMSFLGEYVIRFNPASPTSFLPSIERSFLKFNYTNNHSIIGGKVHTPVNYWNDTYHHGRVFFPVIDRPFAFSYLVPLHTLGIQLQGQNLGKAGFGYDVMLGNGIASSDNFQSDFRPSVTLAFHFKPLPEMRIGASVYYNDLKNNFSGAHIGHAITPSANPANLYRGPLRYQLYSSSFSWFGPKLELLNEFSFNRTSTDSLGSAFNFANFLYLGYRLNDQQIPYLLIDYIHTSEKDLHVYPIEMLKAALGYRHEFSYQVNLKSQLEHTWVQNADGHLAHGKLGTLSFRLQLAYCF